MPNEAMRQRGAHQFADCWCGHGDVNGSHESDTLDGVHEMVNIGHLDDCPRDCPSVHMHTHCPKCAAEPGAKNCCQPASAS